MTINDCVVKLAESFPVGANTDRVGAMVQTLKRWNRKSGDVALAVEHLIETREPATFPTVGTLMKAISAATAAKMAKKHEEESRDDRFRQRPLTTDERDQVTRVRQLGKVGLYYCGRDAAFVAKPAPMECIGDGRLNNYSHVTRAAIHTAWNQRFGDGPVPATPRGETLDDTLDLF